MKKEQVAFNFWYCALWSTNTYDQRLHNLSLGHLSSKAELDKHFGHHQAVVGKQSVFSSLWSGIAQIHQKQPL